MNSVPVRVLYKGNKYDVLKVLPDEYILLGLTREFNVKKVDCTILSTHLKFSPKM